MKPSRLLSPCSLLIACLVTSASFSQAPGERNLQKTREELLALHNRERAKEDLKPLRLNSELTKAAQAYAEFLVEAEEFSHTAKGTPRTRVKEAGYEARACGENIATGQPSAAAVVKDWMESKTHKGNILSEEFTEVGFGIATDRNGDLLWVADFGDR